MENDLFLEFKDLGENNPTPYNKETFNELQTRIKAYIDSQKNTIDLSVKKGSLNLNNTKCQDVKANILRRQLNLVTLDFEANAYFENGYNLVGTIPTGFLPDKSQYFSDVLLYFTVAISGMTKISCGRVAGDGKVEIYNDPAKEVVGILDEGQQFRIHTSWFVKDSDNNETN